MADSALAPLTAASALGDTDLFYTVQGGADRKATALQVKTYVGASGGLTIGTSPITGGTTLRLLYDNAGTLSETAGVTFPGVGQFALAAGTITTSQPALDISQTWNAGGVQFTGIKANFTVTASNNAGFLFDLQRATVTQFNVSEFGDSYANSTITAGNGSILEGANGRITSKVTGQIGFSSSSVVNASASAGDTIFTRNAAAVMQMGAADAAAPVAQTLTVQSVVAGTSNTAGADFTISGSRGTGTGAGGQILFKAAPFGGSGSSQNALATCASVHPDGYVQVYPSRSPYYMLYMDGNRYFATAGGTVVSFGPFGPVFNGNAGHIGLPGTLQFQSSSDASGGSVDSGLSRSSAGLIQVNNGTAGTYRDILTRGLRSNAVTFANAITSPVEGTLQAFTDSSTNVWGATITGSGANHVLGYYNGTNWTVIGK